MSDTLDKENIEPQEEEITHAGTKIVKEFARANSLTQPILYLEKIPIADKITDIVKKNANCLLHTSPILSSIAMNANVVDRLDCEEFVNNAGPMGMDLNLVNMRIITEQITNYVVQNTTIAFCNMLDYTGKYFRTLIDYLPLKAYVSNALLERETPSSIYTFFSNIIRRFDHYTFDKAFDIANDNYDHDAGVLYTYYQECTSQLCSLIYTKLCEACDKAITEVLLGTRVSPNLKYVVEAGCTYFGIKNVSIIDAKNEVYFRLNTTLVNMIDKFMQVTVVPMSTAVCEQYLYQSFYYCYAMVENEYIRTNNTKMVADDYDTVTDDNADQLKFIDP